MPTLVITDGIFSGERQLIQHIAESFHCRIMTDTQVLEAVHTAFGIRRSLLQKTVDNKPIPFNRFTRDREKCLCAIKKALADTAAGGPYIFQGLLGLLLPPELALRILIPKSLKQRVQWAGTHQGLSEEQAADAVDEWNGRADTWIQLIHDKPLDESVYDMVLDRKLDDPAGTAEKISVRLDNRPQKEMPGLKDFQLAAGVEFAICELGQGLLADARNGRITVYIDKKVGMLSKLRQRIIHTVGAMPGVESVETRIGRNYYRQK